jgi:hypothetical protein
MTTFSFILSAHDPNQSESARESFANKSVVAIPWAFDLCHGLSGELNWIYPILFVRLFHTVMDKISGANLFGSLLIEVFDDQ